MKKRKLEDVTLVGIDCIDIDRLIIAMDICQAHFEFGEVKILTSLPADNISIATKINPINSAKEYSRFVIYDLDNYIKTPYVLLVQYDGFILNPYAWDEEFLKYDYIGAPWLVADFAINDFGFPEKLRGQYIVGNGGFSLRSKKFLSVCVGLAQKGIIERYHPEDVAACVYYRRALEESGIKFAPVDLAKKFSFEAFDDNDKVWNGQFGFHGLNWTDISGWTKDHPEYKIANPAADIIG